FERSIFEDILRFLSSISVDMKELKEFIENKFNNFIKDLENDKKNTIEAIKLNKEFLNKNC
ncbi:MAG: hypothetical protein ACTSRP_08915, partial [Candidatus Helarchaeota archaeon]